MKALGRAIRYWESFPPRPSLRQDCRHEYCLPAPLPRACKLRSSGLFAATRWPPRNRSRTNGASPYPRLPPPRGTSSALAVFGAGLFGGRLAGRRFWAVGVVAAAFELPEDLFSALDRCGSQVTRAAAKLPGNLSRSSITANSTWRPLSLLSKSFWHHSDPTLNPEEPYFCFAVALPIAPQPRLVKSPTPQYVCATLHRLLMTRANKLH